ncbi:MAG: MBL fold metallo-hydrolase [Clostridia bacterium]|nr:MBL fold metallo-hydrolase [Clostridia bacterium]
MAESENLRVQRMAVGPLSTNCYIVWRDGADEAAVIDPGAQAEGIVRALDSLGLRCGAIICTHGHPDHIGGVGELRRITGAKVHVGVKDAPMLACPIDTFRILARCGAGNDRLDADETLEDGETLHVGGVDFRILATPGHTPGGVCLWAPEDLVVFTGDTLFNMGVGRTDLEGGDEGALWKSIHDVLFPMDERTRVYPGHGAATTIGDEMAWNGPSR